MKSKATIFVGTSIALLGFLVDVIGYTVLAKTMIIIGFVVTLVGVTLTVFLQQYSNPTEKKVVRFNKLGMIGFLIATMAIASTPLVGKEFAHPGFQLGIGIFVFALVMSIFSSHKRHHH